MVVMSFSHIQPVLQSEGLRIWEGRLSSPDAPLDVVHVKGFQSKMGPRMGHGEAHAFALRKMKPKN